MAFNIVTYHNDSDNIRITKSLREIATFTGSLKNETSILNPVILIETNLTNLVKCNYMYIAEFGRYYFITDIKSIRSNLVEISGHVDVLMTYADEIKSNNAILGRSENNWNLYLNDGSLRVYANSIVLTKKFPSGFTTQNYVMAIASPDNAT